MEKGDKVSSSLGLAPKLQSFIQKYKYAPSIDDDAHTSRIVLRFNSDVNVNTLSKIEGVLNSLSINPTLVSPNFKNKAVFLFVPLDVCKTSGFTSTFSDAFKGICKVSFGSDLIPVKVVFVGLSRIISDTVIDDFCSIFGDVKDIKKDCHKITKLAGEFL